MLYYTMFHYVYPPYFRHSTWTFVWPTRDFAAHRAASLWDNTSRNIGLWTVTDYLPRSQHVNSGVFCRYWDKKKAGHLWFKRRCFSWSFFSVTGFSYCFFLPVWSCTFLCHTRQSLPLHTKGHRIMLMYSYTGTRQAQTETLIYMEIKECCPALNRKKRKCSGWLPGEPEGEETSRNRYPW